MKKFFSEPLLHFLFMGFLIFVVYFILNPQDSSSNNLKIEITQNDIDRFIQIFKKQWQRPPNEKELQGLIRAHLKEEILYREALALGLEKDDTIIRRRLAQKMEFLISDATIPEQVPEDDLMIYYKENSSRYSRSARLSFRHIYFNPDRRGNRLQDEANATVKTLQTTKANYDIADNYGDPFMLHHEYQMSSSEEISRAFGRDFTDNLLKVSAGSWQGPIQSGYGVHLVFVISREAESVYPFEQVHDKVKNDYLFELRKKRNDEVLEKLKSRYEITIEGQGN